MAIVTTQNSVPIIEGGEGIGGSGMSTNDAELLTEKPKPKPSISVREPLLS